MGERAPRAGSSHFSEEDWLDFARGQVAGRSDEMQRHLASGCAPCGGTLAFWRSVLATAAPEPFYAPPAAAVQLARGRFDIARRKPLATRAAEAAALVFDSFRQPLLAGVRAAGPSTRHILYKAGDYLVRLCVEPGSDPSHLSVVGQVVDETDPARTLRDVAVLVLSGKQAVDRTLTNHLGEFHLEPEPADNLRLSLGVPDRGPLTVPLLVRTRAAGADARVLGDPGRAMATKRRQSRTTKPRR